MWIYTYRSPLASFDVFPEFYVQAIIRELSIAVADVHVLQGKKILSETLHQFLSFLWML